jgi:hypothetical protein
MVGSPLRTVTALGRPVGAGTDEPVHVNAALVCPSVVNVFHKTFVIR